MKIIPVIFIETWHSKKKIYSKKKQRYQFAVNKFDIKPIEILWLNETRTSSGPYPQRHSGENAQLMKLLSRTWKNFCGIRRYSS